MSVYFSTLIVVGVLIIAYCYKRFPSDLRKVFYFLATMILVLVAGLRYRVGTDYVQYALNFNMYQLEPIELFSQPAIHIIARISGILYDDYATWFLLMSLITIVPVMKTISKHSIAVGMSVILYLFLGCWHYSFNIVKQSAAAAILFATYPALRDRKLFRWCLACLVAATFHVSALLMIPVYFLVGAKITVKRTVLIISFGVVILLSYDYLFGMVDVLKGEGTLGLVRSADKNNGVNILRILVHCAPAAVYFVFYKAYDSRDRNFACLFNLSLLNAMLNVGSMNSIYLNRFCVYTNIFNTLFIPMLFTPLKSKRYRWIKGLAMALYFVFWAYDLYKGSSTVNYHWVFNR